jgi:dienelactone hydrolase
LTFLPKASRIRGGHRGCELAILGSLLLATFAAHALPAAERVRFESLDRDDGRPVMIDALLLRPATTPATADSPAVIALHGCGGLFSAGRGREKELSERHAAHAEAMLAAGYIVLLPDSFGSRGVREVCTIRAGERTINPQRRRLDTLGALQWLAAQPGVTRDRIALVGWSHGGSTTLATINAGNREVASFRAATAAPPFFRGAVAFYPGCTAASRDAHWRPSVPTRILIGAADDWTPASSCEALGKRARENAWPLEVTVYAGAYHGFDSPRGKVVHRTDVPNGVNPGQGVHVGPDPAAREDANRKLAAFLRETLAR